MLLLKDEKPKPQISKLEPKSDRNIREFNVSISKNSTLCSTAERRYIETTSKWLTIAIKKNDRLELIKSFRDWRRGFGRKNSFAIYLKGLKNWPSLGSRSKKAH